MLKSVNLSGKYISSEDYFRAENLVNFIHKISFRSLSGKLNPSSTQVTTLRVTWSLELVTTIAMPLLPTTTTHKSFI